jgi:nucleoside-diphosphate-sugar epimerase
VKALVTGATGFIGRHLVRELARRADHVTAVVRPSTELPADLDALPAVLRADLRRPPAELDERLADSDVVYHLAAGGGPTWRAVFEANVATTDNLLGVIARTGWRGRLVHASSFAVYAFNQQPPGSVIDESIPLEPQPWRRDDYAWTKLWQERLLGRLERGQAGVDLVVVRPGAVYGRERRFQYRLGRPLGERSVLLLGGRNPMPLTYVENTAALLAECGRHPRAAGEVFNCVDPDPPTQREYLRRWREGGDGPRVIPVPLTAVRAAEALLQAAERRTAGSVAPPAFLNPYVMEPTFRRFRFDTSKPGRVLGWTPPVASADALRRTFGAAERR